jgi:hypothetical protein
VWHPGAVPDLAPDDLLSFECPRCGQTATERFYGPCATCLAQLRASQGRVASEVVSAEYEPKVNVTPNAVALKDD